MTKVMAVGKYLQPDEEFVISDLETIHIVSEPLRLQILEILKETPKTVKQVAAELGVNQVKLYYHFKLLEEHGLLRITEERMVSHLIEKVYQTRARSQEGWVSSDPSSPPQNRYTALRGSMRLAPDQATQFFSRLEALSEDFFAMQSSPPSGGDWYDFVVAMYPVRISSTSLPTGEEKS
jgi:DNA-binding transcriptional ArsR family regulator